MWLIDKLKGVFNLLRPKAIENVLQIKPTMSNKMKSAIELWTLMYQNESPWLNDNVKSLGIAPMIASEKARMATLEMEIKVTGESERAEFIKSCIEKISLQIRKELEYGIALGGIIIKPYVVLGPNNKYKIEFNYTKATNFYPLSFSADGNISEAAFIDRIITKDCIYSKLEYHKLEGTTLTVRNLAFKLPTNGTTTNLGGGDLGTPISLTSVPEWASIAPEVPIANVDSMLFAYFKMPEANIVDLDSPLGASGYSRAVTLIEQADKQYSNLLWEYEGGQLAIDIDRTALNPEKDTKALPQLQDRLFRRTFDFGTDDMYQVFSPQLRDSSIIKGLNNILMHIEDVTALARGTLSEVTMSEARTATELKILKQRSFASNADIQKTLQKTLEEVVTIIDRYCDLYNITPEGEYEVSYNWDDSIIVDKDAERQVDLLDVDKGLISKVEYRMKWLGETETQAVEALRKINEEKKSLMELMQPPNLNNSNMSTDVENSQNKLSRANESLETTEIKK